MIENQIRDTPRLAGLRDTRDYFDVRRICFKFKITFEICSLKGILWKQRLHQRTETRVCIFPGPD